MRYILIAMIMAIFLQGDEVKSSVTTSYEILDFKNSIQKNEGNRYSFGADIIVDASQYQLSYEKTITDTKKPPLTKDLQVSKLFAKYSYKLDNGVKVNFNHLNVLSDNIAITNHAKSYGIGVGYGFGKNYYVNFTQYYSDFRVFDVYQSDLKLDYKFALDDAKIKLTTIVKYLDLKDKNSNSFSKNADDDYVTLGLKIHTHYKDYHFGVGAFFGKRVFAVMNDGFKLQHHAMEFDKTYMVGVGKNIDNFMLMLKYVYQEATELPYKNDGVEVSNVVASLTYKF